MHAFTGKTIRWSFTDGPMPGITFDHDFHEDGGVTWRIVDGPNGGASRREAAAAAVQVNDRTWVVSYLAASGHTLTVVLSLDDQRAVGFASNDTTWTALHGTFQLMK